MAAGNSKKRIPIKRLEKSNSKGFCFIKRTSSSAAKIKHLLEIQTLFKYHLSAEKKKNEQFKKQGQITQRTALELRTLEIITPNKAVGKATINNEKSTLGRSGRKNRRQTFPMAVKMEATQSRKTPKIRVGNIRLNRLVIIRIRIRVVRRYKNI